MNRIAQLIVALSVLFCTQSCNEKINFDLSNKLEFITVTIPEGPQVKAGYEGTSTLPGSFYIDIVQGSKVIYKGEVTKADNSNKYYFNGEVKDWENSDISNVSVRAITGRGPQNNSSSVVVNVQTNQTKDANVETSDFLGATTGNGIVINDNSINVTFSHLMSKLVVKYTGSLTVKSMELKNVCVNGTYDFNEMKYNYPSTPSLGNISMFYDKSAKTYEAIFCPHLPIENNTEVAQNLHLSIELDGGKTLTCPIALKNSDGFMGGKCYTINVAISGSTAQSADVSIEKWDGDTNAQVQGERVLWIGTSIPAGAPSLGYTSYPEVIDEAMNCTIINNARGGSLVVKFDDCSWMNSGLIRWDLSNLHLLAGGLSQKIEEVEQIYRVEFEKYVTANVVTQSVVEEVIAAAQELSYESLIIPYIDGTKDNCTTVIIDHGYNDLFSMIFEANGLNEVWASPKDTDTDKNIYVRGYSYLEKLRKKEINYTDDTPENYPYDYVELITALPNLRVMGNYIIGMSRIIEEIRKVNPSIRIIIGNYFTTNNPMITQMYSGYGWNDCAMLASLICYYNQAVAGIWDLDIVNVQNYLWLDDETFRKFCVRDILSDGSEFYVHPWTKEAVQAIADIYIRELDGVIGSRIK